jgi:phenylalanyl-tRNA synthetase beta subunit
MHADICDSNDKAAVARFRDALRRLGAQLDEKSWAIGVDLYHLRIGDEELSVFSDEWSLDIEGSDDLVQRVLREYEQNVA